MKNITNNEINTYALMLKNRTILYETINLLVLLFVIHGDRGHSIKIKLYYDYIDYVKCSI